MTIQTQKTKQTPVNVDINEDGNYNVCAFQTHQHLLIMLTRVSAILATSMLATSMLATNRLARCVFAKRILARKWVTLCTVVFALVIALIKPTQAADNTQRYSAGMQVVDGCAVRVKLDKPPGVYTIVFRENNYPLKRVSPDSDIDPSGMLLVGGILLLLAEPENYRATLAITQLHDGEPVRLPIDYDAAQLSLDLNECFSKTEDSLIPKHDPSSPYAPIPLPAELRQQANEMGVSLDDFYNCPCGEPFAAVTMQSPPWYYNKLVLERSTNGCSLRTDEPNNPELISAQRLGDSQQLDCVATVGIRTPNSQVRFSPKKKPDYSHSNLQACYNVITAKAKHWFRNGGDITLIDTDQSGARTTPETLEQLSCGAP